jgi:hypothetical protein
MSGFETIPRFSILFVLKWLTLVPVRVEESGMPAVMLCMILQRFWSDPATPSQVQPLQPGTAHGQHLYTHDTVILRASGMIRWSRSSRWQLTVITWYTHDIVILRASGLIRWSRFIQPGTAHCHHLVHTWHCNFKSFMSDHQVEPLQPGTAHCHHLVHMTLSF